MKLNAEPGLYDRNPAATAEVSVAGWVGAAWLACALWLCLAVFDLNSGYTRAQLFGSALATAAIMAGALWLIGYGFRAAILRLHPRRSDRTVAALRIAVMAMFVASFMAATGLFILLVEKF